MTTNALKNPEHVTLVSRTRMKKINGSRSQDHHLLFLLGK